MIALVGSHGVGKTTLAKEWEKRHPEYYCTDGFSRPIRKSCLKQGIDKSIEQVLINDLTAWAWENNFKKRNYLSTRSIVDVIVYSEAFGMEEEAKRMRDVWNETKPLISNVVFVYLPIEFPITADGVRFEDPFFQNEIDDAVFRFLKNEQISFYPVTGSVEERVEMMEDLIDYLSY